MSDKGKSLDELENEIVREVREYRSDSVLLFVRYALEDLDNEGSPGLQFFPSDLKLPPFVAGGIACFTIRCSNPYRGSEQFGWSELQRLSQLVADYLFFDPITFDPEIEREFHQCNPIFMMLRIVGSQFPFEVYPGACLAQPLLLFVELPQRLEKYGDIPAFDFRSKFEKMLHVSPEEFIDFGFVTWAAAKANCGFTRDYFSKARSAGLRLPNEDDMLHILQHVSIDPAGFREVYERRKESDRRFRMYDFNPLFQFPILKPWRVHQGIPPRQDRMVAPVPDLVAYRFSVGIYYEMFNTYGEEFTQYFGYLLEEYVGKILAESLDAAEILSESSIRQFYPEEKGKVVDWVVIEGVTAVLMECKATHFSRTALATGKEQAVNQSLVQVVKGLKQLSEFIAAIKKKGPSLARFHALESLIPVLVTFEPLYLINSSLFREHVNTLLKDQGVEGFAWKILSLRELEALQPHLAAGVSLSTALTRLEHETFSKVHDELQKETGRTYKDSFLYEANAETYVRLGLDELL